MKMTLEQAMDWDITVNDLRRRNGYLPNKKVDYTRLQEKIVKNSADDRVEEIENYLEDGYSFKSIAHETRVTMGFVKNCAKYLTYAQKVTRMKNLYVEVMPTATVDGRKKNNLNCNALNAIQKDYLEFMSLEDLANKYNLKPERVRRIIKKHKWDCTGGDTLTTLSIKEG